MKQFLVTAVGFSVLYFGVSLAQTQTPGTISKFNDSLTLEDSLIVQGGGTLGAVPDYLSHKTMEAT